MCGDVLHDTETDTACVLHCNNIRCMLSRPIADMHASVLSKNYYAYILPKVAIASFSSVSHHRIFKKETDIKMQGRDEYGEGRCWHTAQRSSCMLAEREMIISSD